MKLEGLKIPIQQQRTSPLPDGLILIDQPPIVEQKKYKIIELPMTCLERRQVRRRLRTPDGLELGLALPTGTVLVPNLVLHTTEDTAYVVRAAPEEIMIMKPKDTKEAIFLAHQIGNLHRDYELQKYGLLMHALYETSLELLLLRLGITFTRAKQPFLGKPSWQH
jgi:urease accessory protein